jgi:glycosyltransferase involved in cell wall biosynthesis
MISFIIPALNEEEVIGETIKTIKVYASEISHEIIVVDNGSSDRTGEIVRSQNAYLICREGSTVAAARNMGVQYSRGDILIFLDADVLLTNEWKCEINNVINYLAKHPKTVTGSRCAVPEGEVWIWKYWFERLQETDVRYINSGHLITTRKLFLDIGGFSEDLMTAEDYDFCRRAIEYGAEIYSNDKLRAIHTGYPTSLRSFMQRERWHGSQDFANLKNIVNSKEALVSLLNLVVVIVMIFLALIEREVIWLWLYLLFAAAISICSTLYKFRFRNLKYLINTSILFYFYYLGRLEALFHGRKLSNTL